MQSLGLSNILTHVKLELGKVNGTLRHTLSASFRGNGVI